MKKICKILIVLTLVVIVYPFERINADSGLSIDAYFSRPQTASAVARELKKTENVTEEDLSKVTKLTLNEKDAFTDFDTDLGKLKNLNSIYIGYTGWETLDGIDLVSSSLTSLTLSETKITDIEPVSSLTNLTMISFNEQTPLTNNAIKSNDEFLKPLEALPLNSFNSMFSPFNDNHLKSLSRVSTLTNISMRNSEITDFTIINQMTNLKSINFNGDKLTSVEGASNLVNLTNLNVGAGDKGNQKNQITDFSELEYPYTHNNTRVKLNMDGITPNVNIKYDSLENIYYFDMDSIVMPTPSAGYSSLILTPYHVPYYAELDQVNNRLIYDNDYIEESLAFGWLDFSIGNFTMQSIDRTYDVEGVMWIRGVGIDNVYENHTVTFDSQDGTIVSPITDVKHNTFIPVPTEPTKEGYTFEGWYTDTTYTIEWNFDTDKVTENITLYAKWNIQVIDDNEENKPKPEGEDGIVNIIVPEEENIEGNGGNKNLEELLPNTGVEDTISYFSGSLLLFGFVFLILYLKDYPKKNM
ncbi:MAG: InlB B-repeat-containing protein [Erysipelothrix sp.]